MTETETVEEEVFTLTVEEWKIIYRFLTLMQIDFYQYFVKYNAFTGNKNEVPVLEDALTAFEEMLEEVLRLKRENPVSHLTAGRLVEHAPALMLVAAVADDWGPDKGLIPRDFMPSKELLDRLLDENFRALRERIDTELDDYYPPGLVPSAPETVPDEITTADPTTEPTDS